MFSSKTFIEHAVRGAIGFGSLALAVAISGYEGVITVVASLGLGIIALVAFRGCPVCWSTGFVEMLAARYRSRSSLP